MTQPTKPETLTLQVRSFPADAYDILRRLTFERGPGATYADVIAELLRKAGTK